MTVRATGDFIEPCNPTRVARPPSGAEWVHEIKHDGYRLQVRKNGNNVSLFTRRGYDWTDKYPLIAQAALKLKAQTCSIDGEAVVEGDKGIADFRLLHRRGRNDYAVMYAFDLVELNGVDLRDASLLTRKAALKRLIKRGEAIAYNDHLQGDGQRIFDQACRMGLEGIVSKLAASPYRSGRSIDWVKVRNPESDAMTRYREGTF